MTPQELKNSILQLAIQGKLVPQIPEEGTAEELYQQIQAEKQKLIKEVKIKKEKKLPEITEDEIPFEIPESWKWVRFQNITQSIGDGLHGTPVFSGCQTSFPFINGNNLEDKKIIIRSDTKFVDKIEYEKYCISLSSRALLLSINGTIGNIAYYNDETIVLGKSACYIDPLTPVMREYVELFLRTKYFLDYSSSKATKTTISNLGLTAIRNCPVPIPPLAEQKRIVTKIEELFREVDRYGESWEKLQKLNEKFPEDMKKSLLQYAIQGKLVEQRPEEGAAEELYQQIQTEKQKLIKEGKIKKEKPLPPISEDEIPFEIPESWKWVRLADLAEINGGYAFKSTNFSKSGTRVIRISDFNEFGFINTKIVRHQYSDELQPYLLENENILLCMTGGTVGKSYYVTNMDEPMVVNQRVATIKTRFSLPKYVNFNVLAPLIQAIIQHNKNSTNDNISMETIKSFPIPLPPLAEQKRIVAKLEELLTMCDSLLPKMGKGNIATR